MRSSIFFAGALLFFLILAAGCSTPPAETTAGGGGVITTPFALNRTPAPPDTALLPPSDAPDREQADPVEVSASLLKGIQPATPISASLILSNGTLIDGTGSEPLSEAVVAIEGERIVAVGMQTHLSLPLDIPTIDLQGATILPGFINAHVHEAYDRESLAAWAQSGVTTVRDLGYNNGSQAELFAFRDALSGDPRYARLVAAGPMVTVPGGYGRLSVTSPEEARQVISTLLDEGADLIKIGIEDDLQGRRWPMLSAEEIKAIVDTAHARNRRVVAHISRSKHLKLALEAEVDDVAHMVVERKKE